MKYYLILLLIFFTISCKKEPKELTMEQAQVKVQFEESVNEMDNDNAAIVINLGDLMRYLNTHYIENKTMPDSKMIKSRLKLHNDLVDIFNNHLAIAEHHRKVLENVGITVDYEHLAFNVKSWEPIYSYNFFVRTIDEVVPPLKKYFMLSDTNSIKTFRDKLNDEQFREKIKKELSLI